MSDLKFRTKTAPPIRSCRVCGCTDDDCSGCIERTGLPCFWVDADLCSACLTPKPAAKGTTDAGT